MQTDESGCGTPGASATSCTDPKPHAPSGIRSSFKPISTKAPGTRISELLPQTAKPTDKFAIIRSLHAVEAIHERARQHMFSGTRQRNELLHPSIGSVIANEWGSKNGLPPFVAIPESDLAAEAGFVGRYLVEPPSQDSAPAAGNQ